MNPTFDPTFVQRVQALRGDSLFPSPLAPPEAPDPAASIPRRTQRIEFLLARIPRGARVLDLGCGPGDMLYYLRQERNVTGLGLERHPEALATARARGLNVLPVDLNDPNNPALRHACSQKWDVVLAIDTIFYWHYPAVVLSALSDRVGEFYISVGNSAHIKRRWQVLLGRTDVWPNHSPTAEGSLYHPERTVTGQWSLDGFVTWSAGLGFDCRLLARRSIRAMYLPPSPFTRLTDRFFLFHLTPRPPLPV